MGVEVMLLFSRTSAACGDVGAGSTCTLVLLRECGDHPNDEDLSSGTPGCHPNDEDLSVGTPGCHPGTSEAPWKGVRAITERRRSIAGDPGAASLGARVESAPALPCVHSNQA